METDEIFSIMNEDMQKSVEHVINETDRCSAVGCAVNTGGNFLHGLLGGKAVLHD